MRTNVIDRETSIVGAAGTAAESRRSIRQYEASGIPEADLRKLLRLAGKAPSAYNVQPWRFIVVQDPALKSALSAAAYGQQQILRAPATIVMYSDMQSALERMPESVHPDLPQDKRDAAVESFRGTFATQSIEERENWGVGQSNIALGYRLLLAESMGLATSPMLGFDPEKVKSLLGLPEHVRIPALVSVGYPAEDGFRPHRLPSASLVEFR